MGQRGRRERKGTTRGKRGRCGKLWGGVGKYGAMRGSHRRHHNPHNHVAQHCDDDADHRCPTHSPHIPHASLHRHFRTLPQTSVMRLLSITITMVIIIMLSTIVCTGCTPTSKQQTQTRRHGEPLANEILSVQRQSARGRGEGEATREKSEAWQREGGGNQSQLAESARTRKRREGETKRSMGDVPTNAIALANNNCGNHTCCVQPPSAHQAQTLQPLDTARRLHILLIGSHNRVWIWLQMPTAAKSRQTHSLVPLRGRWSLAPSCLPTYS